MAKGLGPHGWPRLDMGGSEIRMPNPRAHPQSSAVKYGHLTGSR